MAGGAGAVGLTGCVGAELWAARRRLSGEEEEEEATAAVRVLD